MDKVLLFYCAWCEKSSRSTVADLEHFSMSVLWDRVLGQTEGYPIQTAPLHYWWDGYLMPYQLQLIHTDAGVNNLSCKHIANIIKPVKFNINLTDYISPPCNELAYFLPIIPTKPWFTCFWSLKISISVHITYISFNVPYIVMHFFLYIELCATDKID